jgi:hypothetical protein
MGLGLAFGSRPDPRSGLGPGSTDNVRFQAGLGPDSNDSNQTLYRAFTCNSLFRKYKESHGSDTD